MITEHHLKDVPGADVYAADGAKIGRAGTVYVDDETGQPEWVTVHTGLLGTRQSFVPLSQAEVVDDGLTVPYSKDLVKDAPNVDPDDDGHLSAQEEQRLYEHYGLSSRYERSAGQRERSAGRDTTGARTDEAMTRSEERLNVGTRQEEVGRARLRKYVVTEQQNVQVPVSREEVHVEREPVTDRNREAALDGPQFSEAEHEVTLTEERPVVEKEAVPVERVRLAKERVTDHETVSEGVRKERIDTEGLDDATKR
jgi:uncharacterized protein (TIGR02271 family)